jgi:hypothetical protein
MDVMVSASPCQTIDSSRRLITSINGSVWEIVSDEHVRRPASVGNTHGVIMGWFQDYYPGASLAHNKHYIKGMVVEEHTPERCHILTFFSLHLRDREWVKSWQERRFCVGGPNPLAHNLKEPIGEETFDENAEHHLSEGNNTSGRNERHIAATRARWAMSQVEAEDYMQLMHR